MYYKSNQNGFDVAQLVTNPFTPHYYDFGEFQLRRAVTVSSNQGKFQGTLAGSIGFRKYWERRTQDGNGFFQNQRIYSLHRGVTITTKYRLVNHLQLVLTGSALTYSSNARFETNYPYNYSVYSYLMGLDWEFY